MKKMTSSALVMAAYVVLMYVFSGVSFGPVQVRVANSLYALCFIFPHLAVPLSLSVVLSNLIFGGLGIIDIVCGAMTTLITGYLIGLLGRSGYKVWTAAIPAIMIPGLLVPVWLSYLLHIPYIMAMPTVLIGQVPPAVIGIAFVRAIEKYVYIERRTI
jgi:uncharacterized membrane protein